MPIVDVCFRLQGTMIPADHGYALLSALSHQLPDLHSDTEVAVHSIPGRLAGDRCISLTEHSRLSIRISADDIRRILPLAGSKLRIGEQELRVGVPEIHQLVPSTALYCRLVVIKGFTDPTIFLDAVLRQLEAMEIRGKALLIAQPQIAQSNQDKQNGSHSEFLRRTVRIHDKNVVGFAMRVEELTAEESILLQEKGIGGRRRFGCGVFIADRR